MTNNVNISFRLDKKDRDKFGRLYSGCMSLFLRRAIKKALEDKQFFNDVFFQVRESDDSFNIID